MLWELGKETPNTNFGKENPVYKVITLSEKNTWKVPVKSFLFVSKKIYLIQWGRNFTELTHKSVYTFMSF